MHRAWRRNRVAIRAFEGIIENGQIRLRDAVNLPDHTRVYVIIPEHDMAPLARIISPRLVHREQAADFAKEIIEVAADAEL